MTRIEDKIKWLRRYNEDFLKLSEEECGAIAPYFLRKNFIEIDGKGFLAFDVAQGVDKKKKILSVTVYAIPQCRTGFLEEAIGLLADEAKRMKCKSIVMDTVSGFKERAFARRLGMIGFKPCAWEIEV